MQILKQNYQLLLIPIHFLQSNPYQKQKDGLILHIGKNPKRVSHIIIDLDRGRDLYNLTFGKIVKYQFKVIKKLKGIYVDQLHDMIEKYTGNLTTFRPRR